MGIIIGFVLLVQIALAFMGTRLAHWVLHLLLVRLGGLPVSGKIIWIGVNLVFLILTSRFLYGLIEDSKGGTPDASPVWKFCLGINLLFYFWVFWRGWAVR